MFTIIQKLIRDRNCCSFFFDTTTKSLAVSGFSTHWFSHAPVLGSTEGNKFTNQALTPLDSWMCFTRHNHSPRWDLHYIEVSVQTQSFPTMRFTLYRGLSADTIIPHDEIYIISRSQCRHNHSPRWDLHYIEVSVQTQSFPTMRFTLYRGLSADTIIPHNEIYIISRSQCRPNHSSRWDLHHYIEVSVQTQSFPTMRFTWLYSGPRL